MTETRPEGRIRLDIQLLRAVAVGAVLIYHLWPARFPGGFVGVDVFFVISGFLITAHLLRSAEDGGIRLGRFWANRARRLLPLAGVVLLATIGAVLLFLPESTWLASLRHIIASSLYVENWQLARSAVDYLSRDEAPPITQHFWSLSAEEQFYIVWPLLLLAATFIAVRIVRHRSEASRAVAIRWGAFVAIALVFLASLGYSLWLTGAQPSLAYFATTTRAWEFAAGGLLAFLAHRGVASADAITEDATTRSTGMLVLRTTASWAGLLLIAGTVLLLPEGTPFPGFAALLPVVGAALFIWAGDVRRAFAPTLLSRVRPLTYLGDISYGVYLWHWPLIIVLPSITGTPLRTVDKVIIIAVSIALGAVGKVLIEDRFRFAPFWRANTRRGFYPALVSMAAVVGISFGSILIIQTTVPGSEAVESLPSLEQGTGTDPDKPLVPTIANRVSDKVGMYDCFDLDRSGPHHCSYGPEDAEISIALVGDSHAAHLIPALVEAATANGWKLRTYTGLGCDALLTLCAGGDEIIDDLTTDGFDVVLTASFRGSLAKLGDTERSWEALRDGGANVVPIVDVPYHPPSSYRCIDESGGDAGLAAKCLTSLTSAFDEVPDRSGPIAAELGLPTIDLTDIFCDATECQSVINNVIVYQDSPSSHLTATFSRLLGPRMGEEIQALLNAPEPLSTG